MNYKNSELKIDQFVNYLNEDKINLSPAFQRGHVWSVGLRKSLLKNILLKRPIPAVFLYKEASGSKYLYNILDGKQRLESIILFITDKRSDLVINKWAGYFFSEPQRKQANFNVEFEGKYKKIGELDDSSVRDFREYSIPTIEITLDDDSHIDAIISLFVDINQKGVSVHRFDIVKALCKESPLLGNTFNLIAIKETRGKDVHYNVKNNDISKILKKLREVNRIADPKQRVDRMWEKLLEIVMFSISKTHRKPMEILKGFINKKSISKLNLAKQNIKDIQKVFSVLNKVAKKVPPEASMFSDYTHLYSIATMLLNSDIRMDDKLPNKLEKLCKLIDSNIKKASVSKQLLELKELSSKHTTDTTNRQKRELKILELLKLI